VFFFTEKWSTAVDGLVIICKLFSFSQREMVGCGMARIKTATFLPYTADRRTRHSQQELNLSYLTFRVVG